MIDYDKVLKKLIKKAGEQKILLKEDIDALADPEDEDYISLNNELEDEGIEIYEDEEEYNAVIAEQLENINFLDEEEPDDESLASLELEEVDEDIFSQAMTDNTVRVDDPVRIYLKEIGQIDLLTAEEEVDLAQKIAMGREAEVEMQNMKEEGLLTPEYEAEFQTVIDRGAEAKHKLVEANFRLVVHMAKKYDKGSVEFMDLIQEGNMGLMRAADKFDHTKGYKFSTYATWWIRQGITRAIADQGRTIRIPVHMNETINKMGRIQRQLTQELGRDPLDEEIGEKMGITAEKVQYIKRISREPMSLESPVGEEEDSSLSDFISDPTAVTPEDHMIDEALNTALNEALEKLTDREEKVLRMRYGLLDGKNYTLEEVGKEFGVTRERIRQIESKALRKLRQPKSQTKLKEVYYSKRRKS